MNASIFTADGIKIGYSKDKQVGFSGWSTMYVFFDEVVNVLVGIIENPKVQNVDKIAHTSISYCSIFNRSPSYQKIF